MRHARLAAARLALASLLLAPVSASAAVLDYVGRPVVSMAFEVEGRAADDPRLPTLVETRIGEPLSMADVRESLLHLFSLGRYEDIRVEASATERGVALTYNLIPLHGVERVEFRGQIGLSRDDLRDAVRERFGDAPGVGRANDIARFIEQFHRERGYLAPNVVPEASVDHRGERTTLAFLIDSGPRAAIGTLEVRGVTAATRAALLDRLDLSPGVPYDRLQLEADLQDYVEGLRERGYYEADAEAVASVRPGGQLVDLVVAVTQGPLVSVRFEGDPLTEEERETLVTIREEGSVDQDLLEDSARRLADFLHSQGYWKAAAAFERREADGRLDVVFDVRRGALYRVEQVEVSGNTSVPLAELAPLVTLQPGEPFVESRLDADVAAITEHYRRLGFNEAAVRAAVAETDAAGETGSIVARIAIDEGPQTVIRSVAFLGNEAFGGEVLQAQAGLVAGGPLYRPQVSASRDRLTAFYLDRGYQDAEVQVRVERAEPDGGAAVVFDITEGPQVLVDHIIIIGNRRIDTDTIQRELLLESGQPLGLEQLLESQRRLRALGVFRSVQITQIDHGDRTERDVLITVEEAPATSVGYGGGLEAGRRLRASTELGGQAVERFEFAPRGFFEIGRRNLWGKNRSIDVFTRISVRPQDSPDPSLDGSGLGFSEYRVLGTFREPRAFGWTADAVVSAFVEQAIRSSFNFTRRGVHAELNRRLSPITNVSGRFSLERTKLFDERFALEEQLLVDRLFPRVRLSTLSAAAVRDTRGDPLDPTGGELVGIDTEVAARHIGSQVGFAKTFVQGFMYRRLPGGRGAVLALGGRVGLATAFERVVQADPAAPGEPEPPAEIVKELPASERFFAGGDTTVRGYALDRLGTTATIDPNGFPKGGNALLIFNSEVRVPVWRDVGVVGFLDVGNVFATVSDLDLSEVRAGTGFGIRYRSPIGPIRVDLGFKLDRRVFSNGDREPLTALHISIGQAF